ncbi:adenosylcobyric acid synthase (glutamine-hydrolysing) [Pseudoxanthobacter soli DSM 19599]|uniref:Cobyric acid synthase n=2 Tax=Pseudoxanthobacter TaxID=433838 RepID=A0A1M7ZQA2_9HYPH|nr:adenosylcobyric acid synthase (glutamine-hydrolysing) [Pseudoxanthobacter soli DSM 19599]
MVSGGGSARVPAVMFQGTGSDVGKSLVVAGLCRLFARRGLTVRPFKPQNMSNNAAVTADGGEIGRAQALQARAAFAPASVHMNPVLLKPESERGAQVVVQGVRRESIGAAGYQALKPALMPAVLDSFARIEAEADLVLVEGAGSPAEINLRGGDIANMGFAHAAGVPVVMVGDIDRGGVIASLVGTRAVVPEADAALIRGFLVNRFRGDPALFASGMAAIEARTGWRALGLVPWFAAAAALPAEDALSLERSAAGGPESHGSGRALQVVVLRLPRMANFDDLDPLAAEPQVRVRFLKAGEAVPGDADLVVLPGSKATIADLAVLRAQGWDIDIRAHVRRGGRVLGLCGGYQMLGRTIADPEGVEGPAGTAAGLGLLDVDTVLSGDKVTRPVSARDIASGETVAGYEIHLGRTEGPDRARPLIDLGGRTDGARSPDGLVAGTYVHGLFASDGFRRRFLAGLGTASTAGYEAGVEAALDGLAAHLEQHLDIEALLAIAADRPPCPR